MNLNFPINQTSYGLTALNILKVLFENDINYSLFPIGNLDLPNEFKDAFIHGKKFARLYNPNADSIRLFHQFSLAERIGKGKHIGYPIFELDTFNEFEKHHLSNCDELFVCSKWAQSVLEKNNIHVPSKVVPLGVDRDVFNEIGNQVSAKTVFFHIGKTEYRKGHDFIPQLFANAFSSGENVELWMMIDSLVNSQDEINKYIQQCKNLLGDKIKFIPRVKNVESLASIMKSVDCGLFPSRAEGWNLGALEMLSCGKHIIITNYSGHTEFCTEDNSFLIDIDEFEPANDGKWFHGQGNWAKLGQVEFEQIISYMRFIYDSKKKNGELKINTHGVETAKSFTWSNTVSKLLS